MAFKMSSFLRAVLVSLIAAIAVPGIGSLAFSILLAPVFWFYGLAVAILLFPLSFLLTLPAAIWFGLRVLFTSWFSAWETVGAVILSIIVMALVLNFEDVLGENALPTIRGSGRSAGLAMNWLVGLAFASIGASATHALLLRFGLIQNRAPGDAA